MENFWHQYDFIRNNCYLYMSVRCPCRNHLWRDTFPIGHPENALAEPTWILSIWRFQAIVQGHRSCSTRISSVRYNLALIHNTELYLENIFPLILKCSCCSCNIFYHLWRNKTVFATIHTRSVSLYYTYDRSIIFWSSK